MGGILVVIDKFDLVRSMFSADCAGVGERGAKRPGSGIAAGYQGGPGRVAADVGRGGPDDHLTKANPVALSFIVRPAAIFPRKASVADYQPALLASCGHIVTFAVHGT
jgi:hypothetical protein